MSVFKLATSSAQITLTIMKSLQRPALRREHLQVRNLMYLVSRQIEACSVICDLRKRGTLLKAYHSGMQSLAAYVTCRWGSRLLCERTVFHTTVYHVMISVVVAINQFNKPGITVR